MSAFRHGEMRLAFADTPHPVIAGFSEPLTFTDEMYWKLHGNTARLRILGTSVEDNEPRPQLWAWESGPARVIGCIPGHYTWTFDDTLFRLLVLRAICWTAKEENIERLSELCLVGARLAADP